MLKKSSAIDRLLRENPYLGERRFGLPFIGRRRDGERFNPTVQSIADAIDFYGFEMRDEDITTVKDIDLGGGNPIDFKAFPLSIEEMKKSLDSKYLYRYPYTEGDDNIRQLLLDYVEDIGFVNNYPYTYSDIDKKGLCVHNITFMPSTSMLFNNIVSIISKPGDVILVTGPNYGLFTIRAERAGAEVEIIPLEKEDNYLVNPKKLADKIDDINESLQKVYNRRKGYVPRVVAFLNANPNNPTGKVMGEKEADLLKEIGEVCLKRGVFIIDDLVYRDITFDKDNLAKPIATIPGMFSNTISLFGLSKSYGLASLRAGFVCADEIIIREIINRTFQEIDSSPDIVGRALAGAFNTSKEREVEYNKYFTELRELYVYKYNLLKALVDGIDSIDKKYKDVVENKVKEILKDDTERILKGLPYVNLAMEPESGFFVLLDFTKIKGMKYKGEEIISERDLLTFFYKEHRIRFLIGQSISWPYKDELIGRLTTALPDDLMINTFKKMNDSLLKLEERDNYVIRKNELKDQEQMAHINIDGWKDTYDKIIASKYLKQLDYKRQTERYIASFDEYKDLVFVADRDDEVLGYACFLPYDASHNCDAELKSLYIKKDEQGKGIGTKLLNVVLKELKVIGKRNMIVWCLPDNTKAIEFYQKHGGKKVIEKDTKIGEKVYHQYGYYFDLENYK